MKPSGFPLEFFNFLPSSAIRSESYRKFVLVKRVSEVSTVVKNPPSNAGDMRDAGLVPGWGRSPGWGTGWPTLVFLPGGSHGRRSLVAYSPWGCKESDMTERLSVHTRTHESFLWIFLKMKCFFSFLQKHQSATARGWICGQDVLAAVAKVAEARVSA